MKLTHLLRRSLTLGSSSSAERLFFQPSFPYSTTTKPTKSYFTKKQKQPLNDLNTPTLPPPPSLHPRPSEIPYQAKVANSVNLIGHVAKPVQFKSSVDNKSWAGTILTQDLDPDAPFWIPINFEGDLAHIAACHLQEKDYVHVAGQLTRNPPRFAKEQGQTNIQVMVNSLSFVQETLQRKETQTTFKQQEQGSSFSSKECLTTEKLGNISPHEKQDNFLNKSHLTSDNCEHKDHKEYIGADELETLEYSKKTEQKSQKSAHKVKDLESSWRQLVDNPNQWWDNRKDKLSGRINPKSPDFKHKENGAALWLNRAPKWVLSELEERKLDDAVCSSGQQKNNMDDPWKNLVEDPKKWWDNRSNKISPKSPDFKHKETGEALWLSRSPAWVLSELPPVNTKDVAASQRKTLLS